MDGKCTQKEIIYASTINVDSNNPDSNFYFGKAMDFKVRYINHGSNFNNRDNKQNCELKDIILELKYKNVTLGIQ